MALYSTTSSANLALLLVVVAFTIITVNATQFTADRNAGADGTVGSRFLLDSVAASGRHGVSRAAYGNYCGNAPLYCKGLLRSAANPVCCKLSSSSSISTCFDLAVNVLHCGTCGNRCSYGKLCCKGVCTNSLSDSSNCGKCGQKCAGGRHCKYGICGYN